MSSLLIVVNTAPYGSEGPHNAFRLAEALAGQDPCGACCTSRGLAEDDVVPGVRAQTIHDLAAATARSDKVVSF
jgi:sulfur relay (sulfurtransferase) complex TusBCD TusD component (DsrE family)